MCTCTSCRRIINSLDFFNFVSSISIRSTKGTDLQRNGRSWRLGGMSLFLSRMAIWLRGLERWYSARRCCRRSRARGPVWPGNFLRRNINRHRAHISKNNTSLFGGWIFRIKWSLKANLVGRIRILFIVTFGNSECRLSGHFRRFNTLRLHRPIGVSCEVIFYLDRDIQAEPPNRPWFHIKLAVLGCGDSFEFSASGEWHWVVEGGCACLVVG
jgi:hypothetical protein